VYLADVSVSLYLAKRAITSGGELENQLKSCSGPENSVNIEKRFVFAARPAERLIIESKSVLMRPAVEFLSISRISGHTHLWAETANMKMHSQI